MRNAFCILIILLLLPACGTKEERIPQNAPAAEKHVTAAMYSGDVDKVKKLIAAGADANAECKEGMTLLHVAALRGYEDMVEFLLAKGADVNVTDKHGYTPLDYAVDRPRNDKAVKVLRNHGGMLAEAYRDELCDAAWKGDIGRLKQLLDKGAYINATETAFRETPLHLAAFKAHKDVVDFLVVNGAEVDAKNRLGHTPLYAAMHATREVAEILVDSGADVNVRCSLSGKSPLAGSRGKKTITRLLIDAGADINAKDYEGMTPLDSALTEEIRQLLREHGAVSGKQLKQSEGK